MYGGKIFALEIVLNNINTSEDFYPCISSVANFGHISTEKSAAYLQVFMVC